MKKSLLLAILCYACIPAFAEEYSMNCAVRSLETGDLIWQGDAYAYQFRHIKDGSVIYKCPTPKACDDSVYFQFASGLVPGDLSFTVGNAKVDGIGVLNNEPEITLVNVNKTIDLLLWKKNLGFSCRRN